MSSHSSLAELNQAIKDFNPFESHYIVKSHHVWDEEFPDVPSLHTHASAAILEAVQKINADLIASKTVGFTILAPKGVGKTHILSRIRQQLKQNGDGFFIYIGEYGNLSLVKHQFLQGLASSLKKLGSQGVMQWQELATALINQVINKSFSAQQLITKFPTLLAKKPEFVDQLTSRATQVFSNVDNPYVIKAVIWTLSQAHASFAVNWLAGRELSEAQAKMMDLPNLTKEDREAEAFNTIRQILDLVSYYTTPVICLDELDAAETADEEDPMLGGFTRSQVVASLVKDIYNSLKRGVLVTTMYAKTWTEEFKSIATANAIKDRIAHREIELSLLKSDEAVVLVSSWLEGFYSSKNLTPPHPLYPFEDKQIRELGGGATVRDLLQWCAKNFGCVAPPAEQLERIYREVEVSLEDFLDDNEKIAKALCFGFERLKGKTIEGVTIKSIDREVKPRSKHKGYINFRILGEEDGKKVKIGVCVVQNSNGRTVGAAIQYLTRYQDFGLTRGCLIRAKSIPSHWQVANTNLNKLLHEKGGEWVSLKVEEIKPLLVLYNMFKNLDRDIFSNEDFDHFVNEKHPIIENVFIREILSSPSGQSPEEVIDEDQELENLLSREVLDSSGSIDEELELLMAAS